MLGKLKALFDWSYNTGAVDVKIDGSMLLKSSFKMLRLTFTSKLDWNSYIIYIAKTASKKIGVLIVLYIYKSAMLHGILLNCPYSCYFELLEKLEKQICTGLLVLHFLPQLAPLLYSRGRSTHYSDRLHDSSATITTCSKDFYVNSRLWNSLLIE